MRKAILFECLWSKELGRYEHGNPQPVIFHTFGFAYEEFQDGPGNYTIAVIEYPDGRVEAVEVSRIQFDPPTVLPEGGAA